MYANLTRYDLEEIRGCGEYDHVMSEQADGEYVKFADVMESLSKSHNRPMVQCKRIGCGKQWPDTYLYCPNCGCQVR